MIYMESSNMIALRENHLKVFKTSDFLRQTTGVTYHLVCAAIQVFNN